MLQNVDETTSRLSNLNAIMENLKKKLEKRTFFLVLDDVWNEDLDKWNDLKEQLLKINSMNGNGVVVTTLKKQVADMMETSPGIQHEPGKLTDDECWSIIKQKVSGGGRETIASDLESIGTEIAKKCGGLPLLANVLGGTLHGKQADVWQSILKSRNWDSRDGSAVDGASHIRHLNLVSRGDDEAALTAVDAKKLRTVFSMVDVLNGPWKFKSLRTLKLRRSDITELPDSICKLRHLRYLDVSDTAIRALPESITKLYHLETLRFTDCKSLKKLPQKVRNLVSLRHLHFDDPKLVPAELGCLKELRGALKICKLEQVRDREEAEKAELSGKRMNKLVFEWSDDEGNSSVNSEDVLEGLQPHPNIRSLTIEGYGGENFSSWILQLNNLTVLRLKGCSKLRQLPTLGCLPRLKILEMSGMPNVKCIGNEFYSSRDSAGVLFPALQILTLSRMEGLEEWMVPGGEVVEELSFDNCGKLKSIPICRLSSLVEFKIDSCDELRYLSVNFMASRLFEF
uniref:Uncharacterized protein n=1 Tax=Populus alba TaxID=43335 RepID=A0A4U5NAZ4_POPAL|nr:hypothetical protein D5086_0000270300 [Populus alba]